MYYVQDSTFSIGNSLTWSDVGAKVEIFAPNGTGSLKIPLNWDTKDRFKRFYVIGCLKSLELSKFSVVGMAERLPNFSMCP